LDAALWAASSLALGLFAPPLLELEQGHQLQGFDPVGLDVEQLAYLALGSLAVILIAP